MTNKWDVFQILLPTISSTISIHNSAELKEEGICVDLDW